MSDRRDLPPVNAPNFLERVREVLSTYLGARGDKLDRGLTLRDLSDAGIVEVSRLYLKGPSSVTPISGIGAAVASASSSYVPDLTPPPMPTGFTASAGLTHIFVEHALPTYAAGHGHERTFLYGSTDPQATFGSAVKLAEFTGQVFSFPSDLGKAWRLWITWVSVDGVESTVPAGGTEGLAATTGKIGNTDLGPLVVEAGNLANGAISTAKLASDAITDGVFAPGYEPMRRVSALPDPVGYTGPSTIFLTTDAKLYRYTGTAFTKVVDSTDVDPRGLSIQDTQGNTVFGANGQIGSSAYIDLNGNNVLLSELAASNLTPTLNFVGAFASAPTQGQLGSQWLQNAVYRNTVDGYLYVLTGSPLAWMLYLQDGTSFILTVESTNGTTFRVGQNQNTLLKARLFKNGAEVTDVTPDGWFRWRRVSAIPQQPPNDDTTWNGLYVTGYKQVSISVDAVYARATFFCDIISS